MLAGFPGKVVDEMPVGVDAMSGSGRTCAQLREPTDVNHRHAEVHTTAPGVQTNRGGIEIAVFRFKTLAKTVPSDARFVDLGGREHCDIGNSHELNARRSKSVVSGKRAATDKLEWETLIAVSDEIPAGHHIVFVEIVIDLDHAAIDFAGERRVDHGVAGYCRAIDRISKAGAGAVGSRPAFSCRQKILDHRINSAHGSVIENVIRGRNAAGSRLRAGFAHAFVIHEEKCFVVNDRATEGRAELIRVERILLDARVVKEIPRIQCVVAEKLKEGTVVLIGAAFRHHVHNATRAAAILRFKVRQRRAARQWLRSEES